MTGVNDLELDAGDIATIGSDAEALLLAAVDAIIVIDERARILQVSASAARMFRTRPELMIGRNIASLMPEPYRSEHDGYVHRYLETGEPRIIGIGREVHALRADGTVFPCDLSVGEVRGSKPRRFVGIIRDTSARREAEDRLRRIESELQFAQELANLGNYVIDLDNPAADYFSPQLNRILGRDIDATAIRRDEMLSEWIVPADRPAVELALVLMDEPPGVMDVEYRVVLRDGTTRHLHHIAKTVFRPDGHPLRRIGTVHDITDRRRAELETRQLQDRLTHFSRLSTMGEMAAGLAHEVNQPLAAIATYARACLRILQGRKDPDPDVMAALEQIDVQALRAGEVIRRLRHFVRNREVKREPVDAVRLLEDLRTLAETDARAHGVHLYVECDAPIPAFDADPVQIQQVVLNLVRNSIDSIAATPAAPREIVLHALAPDAETVEFCVADHGHGVSPEVLDQLFNPFFTTKASGTGLGLAISRSIIRAHGGRLWHAPNDGGGARFHFTLPATAATTESRE